MKLTRYFAGFALAMGLLAAGATTASAQDFRYRANQRQDVRQDYRRVAELREHIARDRARMNENIRRGRRAAAARDAADLARDERALRYLERDLRHDQSNSWR